MLVLEGGDTPCRLWYLITLGVVPLPIELKWQDSTEVERALRNYGYLHWAQVRFPLEAERINKLIRVSRVKLISAAACHKRHGVLNPYATRRPTGHPSVQGY